MHKPWLLLLASTLLASDLRISEVMSNPQGSEYENEFIEVFNTSQYVIHINGWVLSDGNGVDTLVHWMGQDHILPGDYALILDPGYNLEDGLYSDLLPESLAIFTISTDGSFGSGGLSNSGEEVTIHSPDSLINSSMSWNSSTENGYSWERVDLFEEDSVALWLPSRYLNGSPGTRNSVAQPNLNLGISSLNIVQAQPERPIEVLARIANTGLTDITWFQIDLFEDPDQNGTPTAADWHKTYTFTTPMVSQSFLDLFLDLPILRPGIQHYVVSVLLPGDELPDDNIQELQLAGPHPPQSFSINEIMASPFPDQGGEWIEIWNQSEQFVSLQGWSLSDANETRHVLTEVEFLVPPDSFILLAREELVLEVFSLSQERVITMSTWPTLNSSSDSIRLFDASGTLNTKAYYRGSWGSTGTSLERRHPTLLPLEQSNWAPSEHPDGGTPLMTNTQQLPEWGLRIEALRVSPLQMVGPTDIELEVVFTNQGLNDLTTLYLEANPPALWNGHLASYERDSIDWNLQLIPAGYSTLQLQISSDAVTFLDTSLLMVLGYPPEQLALNEIHYLAQDDETEFIELVNTSPQAIELEGWSLKDRSGTRGFVQDPLAIGPGSYFILCQDPVPLEVLIAPNIPVMVISPWPSLNNTGDSIYIVDPRGLDQISHAYSDEQGGDWGVSLERLALWRDAAEWTNWSSSTSIQGMTPGYPNAVASPLVNIAIRALNVSDSLIHEGESFRTQIFIENTGFASIPKVPVKIEHTRNGLVIRSEEQFLFDLDGGVIDSLEIQFLADGCGWSKVQAWVDLQDDQATQDDTMWVDLFVACESSPLIISEVYPLPGEFESEWIEIYNRGRESMDLMHWQIVDGNNTTISLHDSSLQLSSGAYVLFYDEAGPAPGVLTQGDAWPLNLPSLNNSSDDVILKDPLGQVVDQMSYSGTLLSPGRSIERIRQASFGEEDNWGISVDQSGSTPGFQNSLNLVQLSTDLQVQLAPNPFTPNDDGVDDNLAISFELPFEQGLLIVWVFDMAGRKIATPVQGKYVGHRGVQFWDGRHKDGGWVIPGVYLLKIMVENHGGGVQTDLQKVYILP